RASQFGTKSNQYGTWQWKRPLPHSWSIKYRNLNFLIRPTSSKHVGIFPEQAINWDWCSEKINSAIGSGRSIRLLNLFGYTGAATIAAVAAGASVCHVDSSKPMVAWCAENARLSGFLSEEKKAPIRFIVDDCNKFLTRELRRKQQYDAIILDPPTFGRGDSGELWRLEDQLLHLLKQCSLLLSEQPLFLLMSGYSATLSAATLHSLFSEVFGNHPKSQIMAIPLGLQGTLDKKIIPCGISARVIFGQ
ncbi:MAG: SAM-dependent methyltransferase, partial [Verrucomicrobia bacterium RIFCSPHIGHO2_12_FULL_41_10]